MFSSIWGFYYTLKEEPFQWAPTNAKLCCVRRGTWFSPKIRTAVSEAAGGVHVPHSVLRGGFCLSLAQVCHSRLLEEAQLFPFLKIPKWRMKPLFSNPVCGRGGGSRGCCLLCMTIHWSEHLPLVQKLLALLSSQPAQDESSTLEGATSFIGHLRKNSSVLIAFEVLSLTHWFSKRHNYA